MRLIDAEHLKRWILSRWEDTDPRSAYPLKAIDIIDQIDREDTIALPVILCGECEFFKPDRETPASISWYGKCQKNNRQWKMAVADYCSNGWRKRR